MGNRWRLLAAALVVVTAAGVLAAVALAVPAISIDNVEAREGNNAITTGPNGSGYDIWIQADVTDTRWESTSWSIGGVTRCVNHEDIDAGSNRTVTLKYEYESNPALKAAEEAPTGDLPDPGKVGPSEHVFPPPVGDTSQLRVELFNNDSCNGSALAGRNLALTTNVPGTNKPLTAACQGLKVAVILDESGSIGNAAPQVRNATKALARGLVDTGARMAVFKFSTTADPSFIAPYKTITQAWIDGNNPGDLDYYLDRYQPGGTTNWDAGLRQARDQTTSDKPDLVVFLTDGNPNRWAGGGTGVEEGYYSAMNPAANVANELKLNSHMFAIGVGVGVTDALSALRIQAVSGIRSFPEYSIETADYTLITDFSKLEEALADLASNLCNVTVTVKKETDELVRDAWVYKNHWRFSGRVEAPPGQFNYQWYEPNRVTSVNSGNATQSGNTIADGTIDFVWRPSSHTTLSNINISETRARGLRTRGGDVHLRGRHDLPQRRSRHGRVVQPLRPEGARPRLLRRPEPLQALDRPGGQAVGGRPRVGDDLRRRHRRRAVRRLDGRDRERRRAPRSTTRSQPRSGSARRPCRPATRPRSSAAARLRSPTPADRSR